MSLFLYFLSIIPLLSSVISLAVSPDFHQDVFFLSGSLSLRPLFSPLTIFFSPRSLTHWHFSLSVSSFHSLSLSTTTGSACLPAPRTHLRAHTFTHSRSFIFHLCQSPWSCLRESNPPSKFIFLFFLILSLTQGLILFSILLLCRACRVSKCNDLCIYIHLRFLLIAHTRTHTQKRNINSVYRAPSFAFTITLSCLCDHLTKLKARTVKNQRQKQDGKKSVLSLSRTVKDALSFKR